MANQQLDIGKLQMCHKEMYWELQFDAQYSVIECSDLSFNISGLKSSEINHINDLIRIVVPEDREKVKKAVFQNQSNTCKKLTCKLVRDNNTEISVMFHIRNVLGSEGVFESLYISICDIDFILEDNFKALIESEEKYKLLANHSTDVIALINTEFVFSYISPSVERVFGYKPEEVEGKLVQYFVSAKAFQKIMDNFKLRMKLESENPGISPPLYVEIEIIDRFKQKVWGEVISTPVYDSNKKLTSLLLTMRDISERKKAVDELRKLSESVKQSPTIILITDPHGAIEYTNPKFTQITGYSPSEVKGKNPSILKSGDSPEEVYKRLWETITAGHRWSGEFRNRKKNGELYWEHCSISPVFNDDKEITNFIAVKEDITQKKEMQRQLYNTILETERKERERFAKELHDGLGAHLSAVNVYLNMLLGEDLEREEEVEMLQTIRSIVSEAKKSAREIANNIRPETLTKKGLVAYFKEYFADINKTGQLFVNFSVYPDELNLEMRIEENLFRIISELFNNSLKHSLATEIKIRLNYNHDKLNFYYSDNGRGFDLFKKLKERRDGMGLLNMYKRAESIGGKCEMFSQPGEGFQYKITLLIDNQSN